MKRVFIIVLDSVGIGEMPDAADFGDKDCNTMKRISSSKFFNADNMISWGLSAIDGQSYLGNGQLKCAVARMAELSRGKDTTVGHWEIAGVISDSPLPTYPNGFPQDVLDEFSKAVGRGILCNKPYSGTQVIMDYGRQHIETGDLIVYTSADSVFQIAAHESIVPPEKLYEYCRIARKILTGKHSVGRVIARPFTGEYPNFTRTTNRHDFSLEPTGRTVLDAISENGLDVISVGKISDIFAGRGITEKQFTKGNADGMEKSLYYLGKDFHGLCFINLVDFDMLYGHRQNIDGYANALTEFDKWLPKFTGAMKPDDVLMITADHGCDPGDDSTNHTREYTPLLIIGDKIKPINLGTRKTFSEIGATVADLLDVGFSTVGKSLKKDILK